MSNETKNNTNPEAVADTAIDANASTQETAKEAAEAATTAEAPAKKSGQGKNRPESEILAKIKATRTKAKEEADALTAVGKAACKRHGLPAVWVTADGQCFKQENDARNHGKSLGRSLQGQNVPGTMTAEPLKVEA